MTASEPLTERERLLWRVWLVLITLLVVGSFVLTACMMWSEPAAVARHIRGGHRRWTEAATPTPVPRSAPPSSTPVVADVRQTPVAGPGIVWVNMPIRIYHYAGPRWYGRTQKGKYVSEAEALAEGDRAARNEHHPTASPGRKDRPTSTRCRRGTAGRGRWSYAPPCSTR